MSIQNNTLEILTPRWALPLLDYGRYKGASGGRGGGKSHFFAELLVEELVASVNAQAVCIREIQKSLRFSAKKLIEGKIRELGVSHLFEVQRDEIRRRGGEGIIIFQGMQDHTADSIKSLEGFDIAWVEEAQSISARSLSLLLPTIRKPGSSIWFSWNPNLETDAIESLKPDMLHVRVNFTDNPFCPDEVKAEAERHRQRMPETYDHVWLGAYNTRSKAQVFSGKFFVEEFEPKSCWQGAYYGVDFGFSQDPTTAVECFVHDEVLYIHREASKVGLELDGTAGHLITAMKGIESHVSRADCARPESISYLKRHGLPKIQSVKKWSGSIEDGVEHMKSYKRIVIHPRCKETAQEFRLYAYKVDKLTDDILPIIIDKHNHLLDAIRYSIQPLISQKQSLVW